MESHLIDLIQKRQSVRKYADKAVEREKIIALIEAARLAPSACNSQPWRFIVVEKKELLDKFKTKVLGGLSGGGQSWAKSAPAIIAICSEPNIKSKVGSAVKHAYLDEIDIGIAGEHLVLQATEMGLGTCWIGWFNKKECKKLLHIPKKSKLVALLTVGYPADEPREKTRKDISEILYWNKYGA